MTKLRCPMTKKKTWDSMEAAWRGLAKVQRLHGLQQGLEPYECMHCKLFHLGHYGSRPMIGGKRMHHANARDFVPRKAHKPFKPHTK